MRKPLQCLPPGGNPSNISRQESISQRTQLVEWIVDYTKNKGNRSGRDDPDRHRVNANLLHRNLRAFQNTEEANPTTLPAERAFKEGREWFTQQGVGPFLDKIRNLARKSEGSRLSTDQLVHLYVSNIRARTITDITDMLKREGIQIQQDGSMKFEIKYSKKLSLEAAALSVLSRTNPI